METDRSSKRQPEDASDPPPGTICADRLFGGAKEVRIRHCGQEYRLRKTRNGKLILTK